MTRKGDAAGRRRLSWHSSCASTAARSMQRTLLSILGPMSPGNPEYDRRTAVADPLIDVWLTAKTPVANEAIGLRVCDVIPLQCEVTFGRVVVNQNGGRTFIAKGSKTADWRTIPVPAPVMTDGARRAHRHPLSKRRSGGPPLRHERGYAPDPAEIPPLRPRQSRQPRRPARPWHQLA